ncbi:MAG: DNA cytosine methyltransferase [Kiritimatiellia bacterium]
MTPRKRKPRPPSALDLFAGAGGLGLGLEWAGFDVKAANEYEDVFAATYADNHPQTHVFPGDVLDRNVRSKLLAAAQGVDLVAGGPPCQGFSTVGKKNETDPRNRLFYAFLGIVRDLRPRAVLFENVGGFRRMYEGRAFAALVQGLEELGYASPHFAILNAVNHGVPQLRERTFVVAFREDRPFRFPAPTHAPAQDPLCEKRYLTLADALSDLPPVASGETSDRYLRAPANSYQTFMRKGAGRVLTEQDGPWHGPKLLNVISRVPPGGTILDVPPELRPKSCFANTYSRLWWDRPSTTITRNLGTPSSSRCIHPHADRGLTTREGARLQSFPDRYRFSGSRIQKNLQIGNAVPPLLAQALGQSILAHLPPACPPRQGIEARAF